MRKVIALLCTAAISTLAAPFSHAASAKAGAGESAQIVSAISGVAGTAWQCRWSEGVQVNFVMTFDADGRYFIARDNVVDTFPGEWTLSGGNVVWSDEAGRLYSVAVQGDSLSGKTSTLDLRQSRGRVYNGTIACTRKIDVRMASLNAR